MAIRRRFGHHRGVRLAVPALQALWLAVSFEKRSRMTDHRPDPDQLLDRLKEEEVALRAAS